MSAECQRCGWDLPYDGDCVVCDENGTFCSQLANAQKAAGKLDAVAALRWRIYVIEAYIANGGHRGWMYNSSPFLIPYILDRILEGE